MEPALTLAGWESSDLTCRCPRCVEPVLTLAGWESCGREPFSVSLEGRPRLLEVKRRHGGISDQRAAVLLQRGFRRSPDRAQYCEENMLFRNGMLTVQCESRCRGVRYLSCWIVE